MNDINAYLLWISEVATMHQFTDCNAKTSVEFFEKVVCLKNKCPSVCKMMNPTDEKKREECEKNCLSRLNYYPEAHLGYGLKIFGVMDEFDKAKFEAFGVKMITSVNLPFLKPDEDKVKKEMEDRFKTHCIPNVLNNDITRIFTALQCAREIDACKKK